MFACRIKRHLVRRWKQGSKAAGKEVGLRPMPCRATPLPCFPPPHPRDRAHLTVACVVGEGKCRGHSSPAAALATVKCAPAKYRLILQASTRLRGSGRSRRKGSKPSGLGYGWTRPAAGRLISAERKLPSVDLPGHAGSRLFGADLGAGNAVADDIALQTDSREAIKSGFGTTAAAFGQSSAAANP